MTLGMEIIWVFFVIPLLQFRIIVSVNISSAIKPSVLDESIVVSVYRV